MKRAHLAVLGLLIGSCSLVTDADRDRLGPDGNDGPDCADVESCDDDVPCTNDYCDAGSGECVHEPDDDSCPDGWTCDPQDGCVGVNLPCESNEDCVDETGCATGECQDDFSCAFVPIDADQDGTPRCEGDCDDTRPDVAPDRAEVCGNSADDDCNGAADGDDPACQGGSCGTERIIHDEGEVEGEVRGQSETNSVRCNRGLGPEEVVELVLSHDADVVISTEGSDFDTITYLRRDCNGEEIGCSDNRSVSRGWLDSRIWAQALPAGTYTIVVDSAERAGRFHLRVDSDNPRGATCDRPLDITGGGTAIGHTEGGEVEHDANCSEPSGPAAVFEFDQQSNGQAILYSDESDFDLIQDVQQDECGGETPKGACIDHTELGERFEGWLEGGRYVVLLDGYAEASGRYVLRYFP